MSKIKDGGPAFPVPCYVNVDGETHDAELKGMSLRDWFAGQAEGLTENDDPYWVADKLGIPRPKLKQESTSDNDRDWFLWWAKVDALWRYAYADAMLKVRDEI